MYTITGRDHTKGNINSYHFKTLFIKEDRTKKFVLLFFPEQVLMIVFEMEIVTRAVLWNIFMFNAFSERKNSRIKFFIGGDIKNRSNFVVKGTHSD
jgi:hypothetical protein